MSEKVRIEDLALFGGRKTFSEPRPTAQLYAPDREAFISRLKGILERRQFSNGGPLQLELETKLSELHDVQHVIAFANASIALISLLRAYSHPDKPDVLLPSFSYRGLPHIIQWAGKRPRFCDVDLRTHTLSRADVERAASISNGVSAILAVNNVTGPADLEGLTEISGELGVPLIFDSVYAICAKHDGRPFGSNGLAEVFSLHATKLINGFEGGYVTTNSDQVAADLRSVRNFGFDGEDIIHLGMNGKLNEIHAAMALGSLEHADDLLRNNSSIYQHYRKAIDQIDGLNVVEPDVRMTSNHEMVLVRVSREIGISRDAIMKVLLAENALVRPYFSPPLHRSSHCPPDLLTGPLPNSEQLAQDYIQLPTGFFLKSGDPERLADVMNFVVQHGHLITARLADKGVPAK